MLTVHSTHAPRFLIEGYINVIWIMKQTKIFLEVLFPLLVTDNHSFPPFCTLDTPKLPENSGKSCYWIIRCEGSAFQRGMALLLISLTADSDDQLKSKYQHSPIEKQTVLRICKRLMPSGGAGRAAAVRAAKCPFDRTLPPFRQMQTAPAAPHAPSPRPPTAQANVRRLTHRPRAGWRE